MDADPLRCAEDDIVADLLNGSIQRKYNAGQEIDCALRIISLQSVKVDNRRLALLEMTGNFFRFFQTSWLKKNHLGIRAHGFHLIITALFI